MLYNKHFSLKNLIAFGIVGVLAACGGGGGDGDTAPVFYPENPPGDVQVVAGDTSAGVIGNTISWAYDPAATGHFVYWDTDPNGTFSEQVTDTDIGRDYTIHSLSESGDAGETFYYKVVATDGSQVSVASEVVSGTPQLAISENSLNDVAWNGLSVDGDTDAAIVAVGDSGVIQYTPNGTLDGWTMVVDDDIPDVSLAGVTWGNSQYLVVGASGTVLTSPDGLEWTLQVTNVKTDLEDVAWSWSTNEYIVVGKNGAILTGTADGSEWTVQTSGIDTAVTLEGVAVSHDTIVAVGTHGTILTSEDGGVNWELVDLSAQEGVINTTNDRSDVTWDGTRFGVVGSDSTILSAEYSVDEDGLIWTEHFPSIPDYSLEGAVQWDSSLPDTPILAAVGSAGSFIYSADENSGYNVPTGTNEQLEAIIWVDIVDDGINPYFLMVGHDGTVLTNQQ